MVNICKYFFTKAKQEKPNYMDKAVIYCDGKALLLAELLPKLYRSSLQTHSEENCLNIANKNSKMEASSNEQQASGPAAPLTKTFNWQAYLKETKSKAAPKRCFKQYEIPPENKFKIGMELGIKNRTQEHFSVVAVIGPRLKLRSKRSNLRKFVWQLVDSDDIFPLQARTGSENIQMAPAELFVKEPPTPRCNKFEPGWKIEAVDKDHPQVICVATVDAVKDDYIHVKFDGWRGTFDYWSTYASRDIFPVGWCAKAGHPLEPPRVIRPWWA